MIDFEISFEPRDLWVGVYWDRSFVAVGKTVGVCGDEFLGTMRAMRAEARGAPFTVYRRLDIYCCLVPMFPLHVALNLGEIAHG